MEIKITTADNAPEGARATLKGIQEKMGGLLPNLYCQMANTPVVLEAYQNLAKLLTQTSFSPAEQQLILLTLSVQNGCTYCAAAHSSGGRMAGLDKEAINATRDGHAIADNRLQALRIFTEQMLETRGKVSANALSAFLNAGFSKDQVAELTIGIAMKALSNTFARLAETPLDSFLAKMQWEGNDRV